MPIPAPLVAAGINTLGNIFGSIFNFNKQRTENNKNRNFAREMYAWQRQDALADWNMQNEFNSPTAQMQRLKDAGLNPNLVYGGGANAMSGPIRSASASAPAQPAPQLDTSFIQQGLSQFYDARKRDAEIDLIKANTKVAEGNLAVQLSNIAQKDAQTEKTKVDTETGRFGLGVRSDLRETTIEFARKNLDSLLQKMQLELDQNQRSWIATDNQTRKIDQDILESAQRMRLSNAQINQINTNIKNLDVRRELDQAELNMRKLGLSIKDPLWQRVVAQILGNAPWQEAKKDLKKFSDADTPTKMYELMRLAAPWLPSYLPFQR